ncbi:MAG: phosphate ABC transporter substrate-binding protein PstS [Chroococcus sp. CMT-3BRIN-NPC107]|jgi:phosphate transport system substrate-binding protein|nr:phosphate ABC transporter substrate-binding protein PstS [Chroococcus sp. CMT-3BRIN-NPC107]
MVLSKTTFRLAFTASAIAAAMVLGSVVESFAQKAVTLNGAGATFPEPLYQRYFSALRKSSQPVQVNYQGIGSGGGIRQLIAGSVDFAGSDTALTDAEAAKVKNGVLYVPTAGGPVAVVYNLPGVSNLKLSRKVLPAIFAGQITNWNDPKIAADNPGARLPNRQIRLAVRADSSGTSYIFTNALSSMDSYFKGRIGPNRAPKWPGKPVSGKGNPGVAQIVKRTAGSIGYVEASFATNNKLQTALVQNSRGAYVAPTLAEANKALSAVQFNPDHRVTFSKLGNPGDGYPITGLTWLVVYRNYTQPGDAAAVKRMVQWIMTNGQQLNDNLGYTRIPQGVASRVVQSVNSGVKGP